MGGGVLSRDSMSSFAWRQSYSSQNREVGAWFRVQGDFGLGAEISR